MRIPGFKRLLKTDFKEEDKALVEQISFPINNTIESIIDAINGKLSLKDNLYCLVKDISITVDSSGSPTTKTYIQTDQTKRVSGIQVLRAQNSTNSVVYPSNSPFISFTQENNGSLINNVTGLQTGYTWDLRVVVWYD